MKRVWLAGFVLALLLSLGATTVMAAQGGSFRDENGDGVCDFLSEGCMPMGRGCGAEGAGQFTDNNGDGICDNYDAQQGWGCGAGNGMGGNGGGKGCGGFGKGYCGGR